MTVVLRLTRKGQKKLPFYRIVVSEKGTKRDGKFIETVGTYNPLKEKIELNIKEDRVKYWIEMGAQPTTIVSDLIKKNIPNYLEGVVDSRLKKLQAQRKKRKQRLAASAKSAKSKSA